MNDAHMRTDENRQLCLLFSYRLPIFMREERKIREMIAGEFGMSSDQVDLEFIEKKREELYANPNHRLVFDSERGGYVPTLLENQNASEVEIERTIAVNFLSHFIKETKERNKS